MSEEATHRNEIHLIGRLSAPVVVRELPSRDQRAVWRLVVRRDTPDADVRTARPSTDTVDCGTWLPSVRREALTWSAGDTVELRGALRRRFWRSGTAVYSRYEVDATLARRVEAVAEAQRPVGVGADAAAGPEPASTQPP